MQFYIIPVYFRNRERIRRIFTQGGPAGATDFWRIVRVWKTRQEKRGNTHLNGSGQGFVQVQDPLDGREVGADRDQDNGNPDKSGNSP